MGKYNDKAVEKVIESISKGSCPSEYGLEEINVCEMKRSVCVKCWRQALMQEPEEEQNDRN